jgi:adenosine kinase
LGLSRDHIKEVRSTYTAQAFITTDLADNQITAFHPGAMDHSHVNHIADAKQVSLGIVAPDGREGMMQHAREFHEAGIPFIFDPGQGIPMYNGSELMAFIEQAQYVTVNDYEARLLEDRTGNTVEALAGKVSAFIVTRGGEGSWIYTQGTRIEIPAVKPSAIIDPTGCGDAYRAGVLYGISQGMDWPQTGRLASLMGSIKIASRGGQNHQFTRDDIARQYQEAFGHAIW